MRVKGLVVSGVLSLGIVISSLLCTNLSASGQAVPDPTEQMRPFVEKVVAILTDQKLQTDDKRVERRQKVMDVAHERFDFDEMSKRVLGAQWRELTAAQQSHFVELFTKLLEHAYIGKIESYSKQKVVFQKHRIKGDRAEVQTVLVDGNVTLPVYYIMLLRNGQWMVYDIVVEGVSLIRNYIDQFRQILREEKYPGLVKQLEEKLQKLAQEQG